MSAGSDPSHPVESSGWHRFLEFWSTLPGVLTGVAAVLAATAALLTATHSIDPNEGGGSGGSAGAATTPTSSDPAVPATMGRSAPSGSDHATIDPPPGHNVSQCWVSHGRARLGRGRILAVGRRRLTPLADETYFTRWVTLNRRTHRWSADSYFGDAGDQDYRLLVISLDRSALAQILSAHQSTNGTWEATTLPRGARRLARLTVHQTEATGRC